MNPHMARIEDVERVLERERTRPTCQQCGIELGVYSVFRGASYCGTCAPEVKRSEQMRDGKGRR